MFLQVLSAGVFFIKNSEIGRSFINECIYFIENSKKCIIDGKEKGLWAGICYEQGVMNYLIKKNKKYRNNTYVTKTNIIYNTSSKYNKYYTDFSKYYILHLAGTSADVRAKTFRDILTFNKK